MQLYIMCVCVCVCVYIYIYYFLKVSRDIIYLKSGESEKENFSTIQCNDKEQSQYLNKWLEFLF